MIMDLDEEELLVNREMHRDKTFIKRYIANPEEELNKLKEKQSNVAKKAMLLRLEHLVAEELALIRETSNSKIDLLAKGNVLFNMHKIITNYDELDPTLRKFFAEKAQKDKFETDKEDYENFRI